MWVVISKPLAKMTQSASYSTPFATIQFSVIRSTPLDSDTSTRVTLGRLKVGSIRRCAGPLTHESVVRFERFGGLRVLDDLPDAAPQALHHLVILFFASP